MPTPTDLRNSIADLNALAAADLRSLWLEVADAVEAREALRDIMPALIRTYGEAAAAVAANWYDDIRDQLGIAGRFFAIPAEPDLGATDIAARWAVGPLFDAEPDFQRAFVLAEGVVQRRVANAARSTTALSSVEDPQAQGWQRAGSGECAFCTMLIARGTVYREATVDFASHTHCGCHAVPAFKGKAKPVKPYTPSERSVTDADRARVNQYLAEHHVG